MNNITNVTFRIISTVLLVVGVLFGKHPEISFIRINLQNQSNEIIRKIAELNLDITYQNPAEQYIDAIVSGSQYNSLQKLGLTSEKIIDDLPKFAEKLRSGDYFSHFYSFEEIEAELQRIEAENPHIVSVQSIGKSWEERDIWVMKISDNVEQDETDEADVLYMANMHAREMITPEIIMYFMNWLIDNYDTDPYTTYLINNRQLWLIPTLNPDGRVHVFTGNIDNLWRYYDPIMWRKNKRDNNENNFFDPDSDGVDLNRNFGYKWGFDIGSSGSFRDNTYRGPAPFSEPETEALKDFVETRRFVISLSYHSYGQWWLFPWGHKKENAETPDHEQFLALAENCVAYNGYTPANGAQFDYIVSGDSDDWLYGEQETKRKIFAFTPEVGSASQNYFWPPPELIDDLVNENLGPNIYMAYAGGEEPIIEPELSPDTLYSAGPIRLSTHISTPIVLTQSANLDTANIWLFYSQSKTGDYDSSKMILTGNSQFYGEILSPAEGRNVYYYFSATDEMGRTGCSPHAAPLAVHSFYLGFDTTKPNIFYNPIPDQDISVDSIIFQVKIADASAIDKAFLFYRLNKSSTDSLELLPTCTDSIYQAVLSIASYQVGDLLEYGFFAVDIAQSASCARAPKNGFFRFNIIDGSNKLSEIKHYARTYHLYQNYPNPFNAHTMICYQLKQKAHVWVKISNIRGQQVAQLADRRQRPGQYSLRWNGEDQFGNPLPSGIYIIRFDVNEFSDSMKLILLK